MKRFVGVDGCRAGWFFVALDGDGWECGVVGEVADLVTPEAGVAPPELVLVDVPIGLKSDGEEERECDRKARSLLGERRSSVFPAPARPAIYAADYETASRVNERLTGRRLSRQTWAIVPRIRELDQLLQASDEARSCVREVHPEVCFWGLNDEAPIEQPKSKPEGLESVVPPLPWTV